MNVPAPTVAVYLLGASPISIARSRYVGGVVGPVEPDARHALLVDEVREPGEVLEAMLGALQRLLVATGGAQRT